MQILLGQYKVWNDDGTPYQECRGIIQFGVDPETCKKWQTGTVDDTDSRLREFAASKGDSFPKLKAAE